MVNFAHNALVHIGRHTPYQGLYGRQPALLPPAEGCTQLELTDEVPRPETQARYRLILLEIATTSIIEGTAKQRMDRADRARSRPAGQIQEYKHGELVEIWFDASHKDEQGWRGPAKISTLQPGDGSVTVRYHSRSLDRTFQQVRPYVPYVVF